MNFSLVGKITVFYAESFLNLANNKINHSLPASYPLGEDTDAVLGRVIYLPVLQKSHNCT